ncbi:hypothetical protein ACJIZ3_002419 [Penstemon smallii]|uniref:IST1-like protein n=1 Tax=Penstemon smallii TaxID=265156 RepID=A0ABD3U6G0_9LAMI
MSVASSHWKKAMKMGLALFRSGFNSSKCKTMAKMTVARVKLLRNKREVVIKQMRRDIAMLLDSGQDATARIRVEHVIREQNIMAANELIELFCELVVSRLSIIAKQRECPADLKEGIASLIFAAPRCSDIPELVSIRDVFQKKYGKDFVSAATDLRPNAGVNRMIIEKLSVKTPSGELKLKVLKEIAKEYQVQWDTKESEEELLKPPEERIGGPVNFVSATSMPLEPVPKQSPQSYNSTNSEQSNIKTFQDLASAAEAAAEKAMAAAAEAAAVLAYKGGSQMSNNSNKEEAKVVTRRQSYNCQRAHSNNIKFDESDYDEEIDMEEPPMNVSHVDTNKMDRRHSYNVPPAQSNIRFDESDYEEEYQSTRRYNRPPDRAAPEIPARCVHPKLPDYDDFAARFQALKHHRSQT